MIYKHRAFIKNGKVTFQDRERFDNHLLNYEDKAVIITVREQKNRRSLNLNSYYWAVVVRLLSEETGYNKDEMHEVLKSMFLRTKYKIKGIWIHGTKSTTKLNNQEMQAYIEECKTFASTTLGLYIPDPNEVEYE
jgi:hypothetical protein|tara:strand:+ start:7543 stop:7947 length:405 start_codon:yes stop_codon:yes gene_type:complete